MRKLTIDFAFLIPIAGFVLGLIGMCKYKDPVLRQIEDVKKKKKELMQI